jgi:hypothetical protein
MNLVGALPAWRRGCNTTQQSGGFIAFCLVFAEYKYSYLAGPGSIPSDINTTLRSMINKRLFSRMGRDRSV